MGGGGGVVGGGGGREQSHKTGPTIPNSEGKGKRKRNRGNEPGPLLTSLMTPSPAPLTGFGVWLDVRMRKDERTKQLT